MSETNNPNKVTKNHTGDKLRPPKKEPTSTCNAWAKTKYCAQTAGHGTKHPGTGRCKLHGGSSGGRPKKTFSAAQYLNSDLLRTIEDVSDLDPSTLIKLDNEINLIRTGLFDYAKRCIDKKEPLHAGTLKDFTNALVKLIEAKGKLEGKINTQKIPMEIIVFYVNEVTTILKSECPPDQVKRISTRMKAIQLEGLMNGSGTEKDSSRFN